MVIVDPITSSIYHLESRPSEAGRSVIVDTIKVEDVYGSEWSAKTRVQEYGGGAAIAYGGVIYFTNVPDLRVYKVDVGSGSDPVAVTPGNFPLCCLAFVPSMMNHLVLAGIYREHTPPIRGSRCIAHQP